jgi:dihydrofolate synthase/folylpolyglutamate synthase
MALTSYEQAMQFWFRRVNFELTPPCPDDLRLERMRAFLALLGNPQQRLRIVHVAGSKGKGSTAAMLASILRHAGYRTGLFTSPHLCAVEERIQVDDVPISQLELTALLDQAESALLSSKKPIEPTFFEIATALGFLHFVQRRVQVAVVEVGLGGRFDSTNVCLPKISIITSISLDHTRVLGDNVASIAREKAGIVKPGRPVISGATAAEARAVIEQVCRERQSPLRQLGVDFGYEYAPGKVSAEGDTLPLFRMHSARARWPWQALGLLGEHQAANAAVTLACVEELRVMEWTIPDAAVASGLATVKWAARMEIMCRRPLIVLDCAHNVASAEALIETIESSFSAKHRFLVFACSADKDIEGILRILAPRFDRLFLTRYGNSPRAVLPDQLAAALPRDGSFSFTLHHEARDALAAARSLAGNDDLICIAGSVFLAGELRPYLHASQ